MDEPQINEPDAIDDHKKVTPDIVNEWKKWFISQGYSLDSLDTYFSFLRRFVGYGIIISQKRVDSFRRLPGNMNQVSAAALKSFFGFLVRDKQFPDSLLDIRFEKGHVSKKRERIVISKEEAELIIKSMRTLKTRIMTRFIWDQCLRISSALKLKWSDFAWNKWLLDKAQPGEMNVKGKGNKDKILPVHPETMNLLYENHATRDSLGIPLGQTIFDINDTIMGFVNVKNTKEENIIGIHDYLSYAKRTYRKELNEISKQVIGKRISPHCLRRSRAQALLSSGVPIESLKEFMMHEDISTTSIYAKADITKVKKDLLKYDTSRI